MKTLFIFFLSFSLGTIFTYSQNSLWNTVTVEEFDSRFNFSYKHYYSSGGMGSNYEEIRYFIKNKTANSYKMTVTATVEYTCDRTRTYVLDVNKTVSLKPNGTWDHESDWVHSEFTSWNKKECILSLDANRYTTIKKVSFVISNVIENGTQIDPSPPGPGPTPGPTPDVESQSDLYASSDCPSGGYSFQSRIIREESIDLIWLNQAPSLSTNASGEVTTHGAASTDFIISYRPKNTSDWSEIKVSGYGGGALLENLDPCITYEVKMQRVCAPTKRSKAPLIAKIETSCPSPEYKYHDNLGNTSIQLHYAKLKTETNPTTIVQTIVQYKQGGSDLWITKVFSQGQKTILTGLKPKTQYEVRARYQYSATEFSKYSKVEIIHTLP